MVDVHKMKVPTSGPANMNVSKQSNRMDDSKFLAISPVGLWFWREATSTFNAFFPENQSIKWNTFLPVVAFLLGQPFCASVSNPMRHKVPLWNHMPTRKWKTKYHYITFGNSSYHNFLQNDTPTSKWKPQDSHHWWGTQPFIACVVSIESATTRK